MARRTDATRNLEQLQAVLRVTTEVYEGAVADRNELLDRIAAERKRIEDDLRKLARRWDEMHPFLAPFADAIRLKADRIAAGGFAND